MSTSGGGASRAEQWTLPTIEHEFSSGRTARLRKTLSFSEMSRHAAEAGEEDMVAAVTKLSKGELDDPTQALRLQDAICEAMFVEPRLGEPHDPDSILTLRQALQDVVAADSLEHAREIATGALEAQPLPLTVLSDVELTELCTMALEGVADAHRFRQQSGGAEGGDRGEGLGDEPVAPDGPDAGERRGDGDGPGVDVPAPGDRAPGRHPDTTSDVDAAA